MTFSRLEALVVNLVLVAAVITVALDILVWRAV